jgi:hypothetical protein
MGAELDAAGTSVSSFRDLAAADATATAATLTTAVSTTANGKSSAFGLEQFCSR